jgi:hypothetical protein
VLNDPKTVVVIGGTGHFGGRICRRLVGEPNTELVVTSRSSVSSGALADELRNLAPDATVRAAALDQSSEDFEGALAALNPNIVIHTAGPYQGQDYRVAQACIQCHSHYIDLADGREFVQGFERLDESAKAAQVLLVSGASTLPGLSSAVIDLLRSRFDEIHAIEISIAPAHQTPRGTSTIAAVLSYCGKPFQVLSNGNWVTMHGWHNMRMQNYPALGSRWPAACDVPDLGLLPGYVPECKTVKFHAALEARWEQIALWLMGWLTRMHIVKDWNKLLPLFRWMSSRLINLGSDTGGMHIRLSGIGLDKNAKSISWYLTARQNHGPEIPCTPALILVRMLAANKITKTGAYPCLGLISIADFDTEVSDLDIDWEISA